MRFGTTDPANTDYFNKEVWQNDLYRILLASDTKRVLAVALVDTSGNQVTPSSPASSVGDGTRTVTTAGTRVQLSATSVPCKRVFIQSSDGNTGTVVVGAVTCVAAQATRRGYSLFPSQGAWFEVTDLNKLYIDATVNASKVNYYYEA